MDHKSWEKALLTGTEGSGERVFQNWSGYQHVGRTGSLLPTAALRGSGVTVEEIRSAAPTSSYYPPPIDTVIPVSSESDRREEPIASRYPLGGEFGGNPNDFRRQVLDEVEIRELLIDHVGHHCCWGSYPARTWKISAVEDCNVYVGTLETFIEERDAMTETVEQGDGHPTNGRKHKGEDVGIWDLDLRSDFPLLFTPEKEVRVRVPHSESTEKCAECGGRGDLVCEVCNADQERGFYREKQVAACAVCRGRGLIAHADGSDTACVKCDGKGVTFCPKCGSRGLVKCASCSGIGSLLLQRVARVRWMTLTARKVSATSGVASVPDEIFHNAEGVVLCNTQAYQCAPAFFADSYFLNKFSSEVVEQRRPVPPAARVICERHLITVVPVTRVTMSHRRRAFSFYVVGLTRNVYLKDYYPARFCFGLCSCLNCLRA